MHSIAAGTASAQTVKEQFEKHLKQNSNHWGFLNHVCWESLESVNHVVTFINTVKQLNLEKFWSKQACIYDRFSYILITVLHVINLHLI